MIIHALAVPTLKKLADNTIHLTVTSPPYFNARDYSQYANLDDYLDKMCAVFKQVLRITQPSRMLAVNISPVIVPRQSRQHQSYRIPLPQLLTVRLLDMGWEFLEDIVWVKPDGAAKNRNGGFYRHRKPVAYKPNIVTEDILIFKKPADFLIDKVLRSDSLVADGYERTNVWYMSPVRGQHPAQYPLELPSKLIQYYSYAGDVVLDPFAGSGTTGRAAKKLSRDYMMIECQAEYIKLMGDLC